MANLTRRFGWKKWAPDIGENLEGEEPLLFLELATGLSGQQMGALGEHLRKAREVKYVSPSTEGLTADELTAAIEKSGKDYLAAIRAVFVEALSPYVRIAGGPHTVDGLPCDSLDDYLKLIEEGNDLGSRARMELEAALARYNSIEGPDELFLRRSSGGGRSTGRTKASAR